MSVNMGIPVIVVICFLTLATVCLTPQGWVGESWLGAAAKMVSLTPVSPSSARQFKYSRVPVTDHGEIALNGPVGNVLPSLLYLPG